MPNQTNISPKQLRTKQFDKALVRESLYHYWKPRLFILGRRGPWDNMFNAAWNAYSDIVIHKVLKDMIIQIEKESFTLEDISFHFFKAPNVNPNALVKPQMEN